MKYALISDVHGNLPALEAVLADIRAKRADTIINCGDGVYGPLWPEETAQVLRDIESVTGNCDDQLFKNPGITATYSYTAASLSEASWKWLKSLKMMYGDGQICAFHGRPRDTCQYLLEYIDNGCVRIRPENDILEDVQGISQKKIVFGHSHIERIMTIGDRTLINAGSVGLAAYDDGNPPYYMETYNHFAKYVLLDGEDISVRYVEYDYLSAADRAAKNNREDWKRGILFGRM